MPKPDAPPYPPPPQDLSNVPALTLINPWAAAIRYAGKRIENRSWTPRKGVARFLLHAGKAWDRDHRQSWPAPTHVTDLVVPSAIIGVVELLGYCDRSAAGADCRCGQWAVPGQVHWQLGRVHPLAYPVPCGGRQKLWLPAPDVVAEVEYQLRSYTLVCNGRGYNMRTGRPLPGQAGRLCGKTFTRSVFDNQTGYEAKARTAGWRFGPAELGKERHVMCPDCGAPDAATNKVLADVVAGRPR